MKLRVIVVSSRPDHRDRVRGRSGGVSLARMGRIHWISYFQFDALAFQVVGLVRRAKL
ncbi:hypothetical protein ACVIOG_006848 [Rhizobium leguminosarum]